MKFLALLLFSISLIAQATLFEQLDRYALKPKYGLDSFHQNHILRILDGQAINYEDKLVGSHIVVVGLPSHLDPKDYKEPIIMAGGILTSQHGYADMAHGYKQLGHPVIMISPPGHGAHDTFDITPLFKNDHHFVESYPVKIDKTVQFVESIFPDKKIFLAGHSLGAIAHSLYIYGIGLDESKQFITQRFVDAKERWKKIAGVMYHNGPLLIDLKGQPKEIIERTENTLKPIVKLASEVLSKSRVFRAFFESPLIGQIPRMLAGSSIDNFVLSREKTMEKYFKGLFNTQHLESGEFSRLIQSVALSEHLPEGIKLNLLLSSLFKKWVNSHDVYQQLIEKGLIDHSYVELKSLNTFLLSLIMNRKEALRISFIKRIDRQHAYKMIAEAVEESRDIEKVVLRPHHFIAPLKEKPLEVALVAHEDPLGNSEAMKKLFSNGAYGRKVFVNSKGHLAPMFYSFAEKELPMILASFEMPFNAYNEYHDFDLIFPTKGNELCLKSLANLSKYVD